MWFIRFRRFPILLLLLSAPIHGQVKGTGTPDIKNYKRTDYQSGTQNWDIDQDKNGNVYFANNNGLLQFDGSTWRNYNMPLMSSIRSIKIDTVTGRIYVGGYNEFGYFMSADNGRLMYKSLLGRITDTTSVKSDFIWKIHIYEGKIIFQHFKGAYIYKDDKVTVLDAPNRFQFSFIVNDILYFQDDVEGIMEYRDGKLLPLEGTTDLNNTEVWGMFSMPGNKLLIATLNNGLFVFENGKMTPWATEANAFVKKNNSLGGVSINDSLIVLNTIQEGIVISNKNGEIKQQVNVKQGLLNNTVLASFVDDHKNLWLGLDNGISFINENSPFTYFGPSYNLGTVYASIVHNDFLYAATNQGVFCHKMNGTSFKEDFTLVEGAAAQSWNIQVIGNELICANNNGALVIEGNRVIKRLDHRGYYGFKEVPGPSKFVIGSGYGGLALFEKTDDGLAFRNQITGFDQPSNFFEVDDSFVWVKKGRHLYRLTPSRDYTNFETVKNISRLTEDSDGVESIQKLDGEIYFQANNRFYTYLKAHDVFFEDKPLSDLFHNTSKVSMLIKDKQGNLWYSDNYSMGVLKYNGENDYENVRSKFSILTGNFVSNYFSINAVDSQNVFIGSTDGLIHYNPMFSEEHMERPKVFIRSFSFAKDTIVQANPQTRKHDFRIPYSSNNIRFTFSSPAFVNPGNVTYSYQLEPFDEVWSNWSISTVKEYTNLREGDYIMKVRVKNSFDVQSDETRLAFTIYPPWYRHYLAYISYILIFILGLYLLSIRIKMKLRKDKYYQTIEQRKIYLEKESRIRREQYELEKQIEKLNREQLQTKLLAKDKELVNNSLQVAKKNRVLNGIISKLKNMDVDSMNQVTKDQFIALKKSILKETRADKSWKDLEKHIKNIHFEFLKRLQEKYPDITPGELNLSTYLLINLSTKEIAEIMNISKKGVELARYRLRRKLGLGRKESLTAFLMNI